MNYKNHWIDKIKVKYGKERACKNTTVDKIKAVTGIPHNNTTSRNTNVL